MNPLRVWTRYNLAVGYFATAVVVVALDLGAEAGRDAVAEAWVRNRFTARCPASDQDPD
jgi:hypothetical protein